MKDIVETAKGVLIEARKLNSVKDAKKELSNIGQAMLSLTEFVKRNELPAAAKSLSRVDDAMQKFADDLAEDAKAMGIK